MKAGGGGATRVNREHMQVTTVRREDGGTVVVVITGIIRGGCPTQRNDKVYDCSKRGGKVRSVKKLTCTIQSPG